MRPSGLQTQIFLDGGDPSETRDVLKTLGFLDGQTTNPSLVSKNPKARERLERGEKFTSEELLHFYREVVEEISGLIPDGSVSVEVYADADTPAETMLRQADMMFGWIPNAHIKFPSSSEGLTAARRAVDQGIRVNMTLCFTQEQGAAAYSATTGAERGNVFVSPFVGRLDDRGENGMDLIENLIRMYASGDGHVEVLTASVRNIDHLLHALRLGSDIVSVPYKILTQWSETGLTIPGDDYVYRPGDLSPIHYREIDLDRDFEDYDIRHELTDKGMERFSADWNALIQ